MTFAHRMNRRGFLGALAALVAGAAVPKLPDYTGFVPFESAMFSGEIGTYEDVRFITQPIVPAYTLLHTRGPGACGGPAYRMLCKPQPGDRFDSQFVFNLDCSAVQWGSRIVCGSCGRSMGEPRTADVVLST